MVGERGFEPPTPWSRTRCSTRLSHSPTSVAEAYRGVLPGAFIPLMRLGQCSRILPPVEAARSFAQSAMGPPYRGLPYDFCEKIKTWNRL